MTSIDITRMLRLCLVVLCALLGTNARAQEAVNKPPVSEAESRPRADVTLSPAELFRLISPSVVSVEVYDERNNRISSGSGFFVHSGGLVVTNMHVISRGHDAIVRRGKDFAQSVLGVVAFDQGKDLAILAVPHSDSPTLKLTARSPSVGTPVFAIGNPIGMENTISDGLVSGYRTIGGLSVIQTTAPISRGSSGGPLLLPDGQVAGVVYSQLVGGQNLNFAVPASEVQKLLERCGKPKTLLEVNRLVFGAEAFPATISDDNQKLAAAGKAFRKDDLRETIRLLSEVPESQRGAGYWAANGTVQLRLSNYKAAHKAFESSLKMDGSNTQTLLKFAVASMAPSVSEDDPPAYVPNSISTWDKCVAACKRASELDPLNAEAYNILGIHFGSLGESVAMFKTAVALDRDHLGAHYNLGVRLLNDDKQDAIKHFRRTLDLAKTSDQYELITFHKGAAIFDGKGFSKTNSIEVLALLGLGSAYADAGNREAAEGAYRQVLKLEPNNGHAYCGICMIYRTGGKFKDPTAVLYERKAEGILGSMWYMGKICFPTSSPAVIRKSTLAF
jgi:S1-C subfamily serine protease